MGAPGREGRDFDLEFVHRLDQSRHEINLDVQRSGQPRVRGKLVLTEDLKARPSLSVCVPTIAPHFFYTHKAYMPISGELEVGGEKIFLDPRSDLANLDEHRNYAQVPARWTWGTAGGDYEGKLLAFNLGDTGGIDQENWNENCLWIGDRLELLGPVQWRPFFIDRMNRIFRISKKGRFSSLPGCILLILPQPRVF